MPLLLSNILNRLNKAGKGRALGVYKLYKYYTREIRSVMVRTDPTSTDKTPLGQRLQHTESVKSHASLGSHRVNIGVAI